MEQLHNHNFKLIQVSNHFVEKDKTYLYYIPLKVRGNSRITYPIAHSPSLQFWIYSDLTAL